MVIPGARNFPALGTSGNCLVMTKTISPRQLTPAQRREDLTDLLARGVLRMLQRNLLESQSVSTSEHASITSKTKQRSA